MVGSLWQLQHQAKPCSGQEVVMKQRSTHVLLHLDAIVVVNFDHCSSKLASPLIGKLRRPRRWYMQRIVVSLTLACSGLSSTIA